MDVVTIKLEEENETNTAFTEIPEPQVILLAPPAAFLPRPGKPAIPWERWLRSFELYLDSLGKANLFDSAKCVLLQHCLGKEGKCVYAKLLPGNTKYKAARAALTTYFGQHVDIKLLENGTLSTANTELIGKQIDHGSAPSVLQRNTFPLSTSPHIFTVLSCTNSTYSDDKEENHVEAEEETEQLAGDGSEHSGGGEEHGEPNGGEAKPARTRSRDLSCPICVNKSFIVPSKLARHMRIHTKEKLFSCTICAKIFSEDYHLRRHLRVQHSVFLCSKCEELFPSVDDLEKHKSIHGSRDYPCPSCDRKFFREVALLRHSESHSHDNQQAHLEYAKWRQVFANRVLHNLHIETTDISEMKKLYECPYCLKTVAYRQSLRKHVAMHEKEMKGTCPKCGETSGSLEELKIHMESHERSYSCATCGKQFKLETALKKHEQVHRDKRYDCTLCDKYFERKINFEKHMKFHVKRESKCPHCDGIFLRLTSFKTHLRSHVDERPYRCQWCIECFTVESDLEKHCLRHQKFKLANPYSCTRCDYAFSTLSELTVHMEQHDEEPALNCPHCGKLYLNKAKLEKHVSIHTGERKHLCSICGHGFVGPLYLKIHMAVHTSEKAHKCTKCSKSFKTESGLRMHSARHLAAPPRFLCSECGRSYGRMVELKMHQRYHTGDKAHKCTCCSKRFVSHYKLKVHMRTHTGEKPYACSKCSQTFTQMGGKKRHMDKYHK